MRYLFQVVLLLTIVLGISSCASSSNNSDSQRSRAKDAQTELSSEVNK